MSRRVLVEDVDAARKTWSQLRAIAALRGIQLFRTDGADGPRRFVVSRWGMTLVLPDLPAVEAWLEQAGVTLATSGSER